uniref:Uncharacterized protein n=1 Tax=Amphora coffeiformis TaxID=265554 RepID=A0A7S3P7H1_9STRA|eukprot:scaffold8374_cov175-Amphora_coffeaeformis.AAC.43
MAPRSKNTGTDFDTEIGTESEYGVEKNAPADFQLKSDHQKTCLLRLGIKCLCMGFFVLLAGGAVAGLSIAFTGDPNPANYFVPVDPPGAKEAVRWDASAGLYLTVENACDETWAPFFDQSIQEWNETEALILKSEKVRYDSECNPSRGRLKVCNGDYGPTEWKGLNTAVVSATTGTVVYSVSTLNDYHLHTDDDKAYTMCHENGHGFGLPHTDEDHFNRDRGDCMDYTTRTWNNRQPGQFNLDLLVTLYGTPSQPLTSDPLAEFSTLAPMAAPRLPTPPTLRPWRDDTENEKEEDDEREDDRRRFLREDLDASFDSEVATALENCKAARCVHVIDEQHSVVISKLMA